MAKKDIPRPKDLDEKITAKLDEAFEVAEEYFATKREETPAFALDNLNQNFIDALEIMAKYCEKASTGYSNLITSLSIKSVFGEAVDVRYHQVQIQDKTDRPAGFNFRGVSEEIIYPWMEAHEFHGAKSGWQTRTFERPKPYMLDYDENIGTIKVPFLVAYDQVETHKQSAFYALAFLLWRRLQLREASKVVLAIPKIQDVLQITKLFEAHFFYTTHAQHEPSEAVLKEVENVKKLLGCQLIVNGVIPSIKYYLRILTNPGAVIPAYVNKLEKDEAVGFEHRDIWNKIATGIISMDDH